ncbi:MAG: TPM domain-containing protein [Gemmatimonadales bacterium]|jgi:uncharacterized protein
MLAFWLALLLQLQIPSPTGFVNDFAGVIDPASRQAMLGVIAQVRQASRGEIVVVTLRDLGGRPSIEVGRDIIRAWGVGAKGGPGDSAANAGVVLLLKPGERPGDGKAELAVVTGTGAEGFVTDALAGRIRDAVGREATRTGSYASGLALGVGMLGQAYAQEFGFRLTAAPAAPAPEETDEQPARRRGSPVAFLVILFIIIMIAGRHRGGGSGLLQGLLWASILGGGRGGRGGWGGGGFGGGGGGGFGGFGGGGGSMGGGASGGF